MNIILTKKKGLITLSLGIVLGFLILSTTMVAALPNLPNEDYVRDIMGNRYQGQVEAGKGYNFRFQDKFQFRFQMNKSAELDINADVDQLGLSEFSLNLNTSSGNQICVEIKGEDSELNLTEGAQVKVNTQTKYIYRHKFMMNISIDNESSLQARIMVKTGDPQATWAYFNEESGEWEIVESAYSEGYTYTDTDHFSIWTILTPDDSEDSEDTGDSEPSIDGYIGIYFTALMGIAMLGIFIQKKRR